MLLGGLRRPAPHTETSMRIETEFSVNAPVATVWDHLLDVEQIVTCVPGAQITEKVSDDEYKGRVELKVGPLGLKLQGSAVIESRDVQARVITLAGKGRDQQGKGAADVSVVARITDAGGGSSTVAIEQDLRVTGRIAQFGRGVMKDVSQRLSQEFADCLEGRIAAEAAAPPPAVPPAEPGERASQGPGAASGPASAPGSPGPTGPAPSPPSAPPRAAKPVGGLSLLAWVLRQAVGRLLRRLTGRHPAGG